MDPPSYGRGPKGEIWKIEDSIYPFIQQTEQLLSDDPLFFLINSYTTGLAPSVLTYMISTAIIPKHGGSVESGELGLPVSGNGLCFLVEPAEDGADNVRILLSLNQ